MKGRLRTFFRELFGRAEPRDHVIGEIGCLLSKEARTLERMLFRQRRVIETFIQKEAYSGFVLFAAAAVAMIWANSPASDIAISTSGTRTRGLLWASTGSK